MIVIDKTMFSFFGVIVLFVLILCGYMLVKSVSADGRISYCYISYANQTQMSPGYILRGYREWREDSYIGVFTTQEAAIAAARLMGCQLSTEKK